MLVHNKGNYIRHIGVRLLPGANELNAVEIKEFRDAVKQPLNSFLVDSGEIVVSEVEGITNLNVKDATSLIKDTFDLALLDKWHEDESSGEKRKGILKAIDEQIESIKNPPADKIVSDED